MPVAFTTAQLDKAVLQRTIPQITVWNRLEGRPRADNFDRALRAEVRDALWMITRQWQTGEFQGDDAGSPILAKLRMETTQVRKYSPVGGPVEAFDDTIPLEAKVERRPVPFFEGGQDISLDLRLLMGRQWLKMIAAIPGNFAAAFIAKYPIHSPAPDQTADGIYCAHPEAWSAFAAASGRRMDGAKLYLYLKDASHHASDGIAGLAAHQPDADAIAARFVAWFEKLIFQPQKNDAWEADRFEYQMSVSAPTAGGAEKVLAAEEYYQGRLDWYSFDVDSSAKVLGAASPADPSIPSRQTQALLPTAVTFNGMPNTRWWAFEDGSTNFGDIKPDTTDLGKLMLIDFGLIYANDWFLIPYTLPFGSIAQIKGLVVTNTFGERTWVQAAGSGANNNWQRWAMFLNSVKSQSAHAADTSLFVPPVLPASLEGKPLEEVMLIRDEIANMVWAVERTIPLPTGEPKTGREAAFELRAFLEQDLERRLGRPPEPPPAAAPLRYQLMNSVPENWIPFIPVHVPGDNRQIQLQRAAMPRVLIGDTDKPVKVRPRTTLIREGLDSATPQAYFVHEEEVPRAGICVTESYQRTRWRDGRAWLWLGMRKQTGRGEGSSKLAFDSLIPSPPKP